MKDYLFEYEAVSVYACAVQLLGACLQPGRIHLDLGCGEGAIASKIIESGAVYIGFDINEKAVSRLRAKGFEAHKIDLSEPLQAMEVVKATTAGRSICSISMLDTVEHLPYDSKLLRELSSWLLTAHPDAKLVTSIPNFSHADICVKLMGGRWDYTESGLLDRTHDNVLTESSMHRFLNESGWISLGVNNYELTVSDQRGVSPKLYLANSEFGVGRQLRGIKKAVDTNHQVYQFVNLWTLATAPIEQPESVDVINFVTDAMDDASVIKYSSTGIIRNIPLRDGPDGENLWKNVIGEYVVFTEGDHLEEHPMLGFIQSILKTDERPVLVIDAKPGQKGTGILDLEISPGPWIAIPAQIVKHYFPEMNARSLTSDQWQKFIVAALVICGMKTVFSAAEMKRQHTGIFSPLTLRKMAEDDDLEAAVSAVWSNVNDLRGWLCLPERLHIKALQDEHEKLKSDIALLKEIQQDLNVEVQEAGARQAELLEKFENYRNEIEASIGWKMTSPLRWLAATLKTK